MKVMHLISGGDSGGAKTHLENLVFKLSEYAEITIACLMEGEFYTDFKANYPNTVLYKQKNRMDMSVVKDIVRTLKTGNYDLLHVHGARANFVSVFIKNKIDIPIVTTMHSDYLLDFDDFFKKLVYTNMNRFALRKIDYFIAVSDAFSMMLRERNFRPNSIQTVYNGMNFSAVPQTVTDKKTFAENYGIAYDENCIYVGILARLDLVKDVATFIRCAAIAAKQNSRLRFLIGGDGAERKNLEALVRELKLGDKLQFLGFVSDNYGFLNFIDINTLTSLCESFPYSMLEGAAMRLPMVASRVGGIPALIRDGETGYLFDVGNAEQMGAHILKMAAEPALLKQMGDNIYTIATTRFSDDSFAQKHMEMYKNILKDYKDEKHYDVLLSGYYGFQNSGDDALLLAILNGLKEKEPNLRAAVLSAAPKDTRMQYGVDAIARGNLCSIRRAMKKSRMLISGGGSLIQDETSPQSLWYYLSILRLAKAFGLKVIQLANGFGPVKYKYNERLCRKIIPKSVDMITLRDSHSESILTRLGLDGVKHKVTADPALTLVPAKESRIDSLLDAAGLPKDAAFITVSVRTSKNARGDFKAQMAQALDTLAAKHKRSILFLPMQYPRDLECSRDIARRMKTKSFCIETAPDIEQTMQILKKADMIVAMRLHTLIYAAAMGKNAVAIDYDPKIRGFMQDAKMTHCIPLTELNADLLVREVDACMQNQQTIDNTELCKRARENMDIAIALLNQKETANANL